MSDKDGGPTQFPGDLRDWFAGKAMQALLSKQTTANPATVGNEGTWLVSASYHWADAMIEERAK